MAGFTSFDDLLNEMSVNGKILEAEFWKVGTTPETATNWHSLW
jgi:hypothetical protein